MTPGSFGVNLEIYRPSYRPRPSEPRDPWVSFVEGRSAQGKAAGQAAGVAQLAVGMNDQTDPPVRQGMAGG